MEFSHISVLLQESVDGLNINPDGIYVDGTLGGAGHSKKILQNLDNTGKLIGIDRDTEALNSAKEKLKDFNNVKYVHGNHDDKYEKRPPEGCICIEDDIFVYREIRILGLGGSMKYKEGEHQYSEWEMRMRVFRMIPKIIKNRGIFNENRN